MQTLSYDQIRSAAPAVFATEKSHRLTKRYQFFSTIDAIHSLADEGYAVVQAKQDKARRRDPGTVRHSVVLRAVDTLGDEAKVGEIVPQILLTNSHNGRTRLSVRAGLYRFVCANGMVVGNDKINYSLRHSINSIDGLMDKVKLIAAQSSLIQSDVERWRAIELSESSMHDFAKRAAVLRFGAERGGAYDSNVILEARREDDDGRSLWKVFNRVQENTTTQSLSGRNAAGRAIRSRPINNITMDIDYNEALWQLANSYAEA